MLISQGLYALLWCTLALAGTPSHQLPAQPRAPSSSQSQLTSGLRDGRYPTGPRDAEDGIRSKMLPTWRRRRTRAEPGRMATRLAARQNGTASACTDSLVCPDGAGSFQCCGEGFACCMAEDGTGACCPTEQKAAEMAASCVGADCTEVGVAAEVGAAPTVIVTTTIRRTVTVGSSTSTTVVPVTVFQTLTFQDPALRTQTLTVTVTSGAVARSQVRRQDADAAAAAPPQTAPPATAAAPQPTVTNDADALNLATTLPAASQPLSEVGLNADAVAAVTLTTTVELVATITGVVTVTSAVFNTVFVTQTLAPSATATVFTTTTVAPRPEFTGGLLPGGFIPPTGNEGLIPANPPNLSSGLPDGSSLLPPGAGQNPTSVPTGTQLPPGVTGILPPGNPQSMMPTNMNPSPTGPVRPVPGSNLTSDDIAGIALGIIFGLFFLILAGFLIYRLIKKKEALDMSRQQQEMISSGSRSIPVGAASILSNATENRLIKPAPAVVAAGALGSDGTSSTGPGEGDVRIVIRPAPKRRTQSSGLFAPSGSGKGSRATSGASSAAAAVAQGSRRAQFPRPPGYNGQTYSFFVEESGSTSPQDPKAWSLASDDGSRAGPGSPADNWTPTFPKPYDPTRRDNGGDRGAGGSGVGGSDFLSVGRALSPWKPI